MKYRETLAHERNGVEAICVLYNNYHQRGKLNNVNDN